MRFRKTINLLAICNFPKIVLHLRFFRQIDPSTILNFKLFRIKQTQASRLNSCSKFLTEKNYDSICNLKFNFAETNFKSTFYFFIFFNEYFYFACFSLKTLLHYMHFLNGKTWYQKLQLFVNRRIIRVDCEHTVILWNFFQLSFWRWNMSGQFCFCCYFFWMIWIILIYLPVSFVNIEKKVANFLNIFFLFPFILKSILSPRAVLKPFENFRKRVYLLHRTCVVIPTRLKVIDWITIFNIMILCGALHQQSANCKQIMKMNSNDRNLIILRRVYHILWSLSIWPPHWDRQPVPEVGKTHFPFIILNICTENNLFWPSVRKNYLIRR